MKPKIDWLSIGGFILLVLVFIMVMTETGKTQTIKPGQVAKTGPRSWIVNPKMPLCLSYTTFRAKAKKFNEIPVLQWTIGARVHAIWVNLDDTSWTQSYQTEASNDICVHSFGYGGKLYAGGEQL
jgi:hypothetical protein|tara:strand:- start:2486 stop:2860 length:375 start_codon:yes stop_codon:yes gene_type:complete